jgi:hypothetical protein
MRSGLSVWVSHIPGHFGHVMRSIMTTDSGEFHPLLWIIPATLEVIDFTITHSAFYCGVHLLSHRVVVMRYFRLTVLIRMGSIDKVL